MRPPEKPAGSMRPSRRSASVTVGAVPPLPIAGGPRIGAGAVRPDRDPVQPIDARDRAAAGADLDHLDDRDAQRQPAALLEAIDPRDLERAARLRLQIVDQANLRGGAAHVVGQHLVEPALPGDLGGKDGAARGTRFDEPDREADRGLDRGQAAARQHQEERAEKALAAQQRVEISEVAADQRLDVGIGASRRKALVFAHLGRHVARQGDRHARQALGDNLASPALMRRIGEAVQKADRDGLDAAFCEAVGQRSNAVLVERHQHPAARVHPLAHREAQAARHERRRQVDIDVVLLEPVLVADLDRIAEALGRQQCGLGAFALDDRVGRESRPVNDDRQFGGCERRFPQHDADRFEDGALRRRRGGQDLGAVAASARFERNIGERAADIYTEPCLGHTLRRHSPASDFAAEAAVDRQRAAAADQDRQTDQQQV